MYNIMYEMVETIPAEPGKRTLTKEEYVAKQLRTEVAELSQERKKIAKEATELAVERDMLKEETHASEAC